MSGDPLYDFLAEGDTLYLNEPPQMAPLVGMREALRAMEKQAFVQLNRAHPTLSWRFFDARGNCIVSSPSHLESPDPRNTSWWRNVCHWQAQEDGRRDDLLNEVGPDEADAFGDALSDEAHNALRAALANAWNARHPKLAGGWDDKCECFVVAM